MLETKRGDELLLDVTRVDAAGAPVDLTGQTITSAVRLRDGFLDTLSIVPVSLASGTFRLRATAAQTALWPVATLSCDVKYDAGGGSIRRSSTFQIRIVREVTQ